MSFGDRLRRVAERARDAALSRLDEFVATVTRQTEILVERVTGSFTARDVDEFVEWERDIQTGRDVVATDMVGDIGYIAQEETDDYLEYEKEDRIAQLVDYGFTDTYAEIFEQQLDERNMSYDPQYERRFASAFSLMVVIDSGMPLEYVRDLSIHSSGMLYVNVRPPTD
jgi:hypothetical protein